MPRAISPRHLKVPGAEGASSLLASGAPRGNATDSNNVGASFNSNGPQVDVSAPGVYTGSAGGPNVNSYHILDGTSMACPHVAGVAALIKTLNPTFTRAQVESRLTSTALDLGPAGKDDTYGYGRINAAAAVY